VPDYDDPAFLTALCDAGCEVTISGFLRAPPPKRSPHQAPGTDPARGALQRLESFDGFLLPHRVNEFMKGVIPARSTSAWPWDGRSIATPLPFLVPFARKGPDLP